MDACARKRSGSRLTAIAAAAAIVFANSTLAAAEEAPRYFYGPHIWEGGWWMFLGPVWMILFLAVVVALVVLAVRWLGDAGAGRGGGPARQSAFDILRERFARGEIDKDEFEERKRVLGE